MLVAVVGEEKGGKKVRRNSWLYRRACACCWLGEGEGVLLGQSRRGRAEYGGAGGYSEGR